MAKEREGRFVTTRSLAIAIVGLAVSGCANDGERLSERAQHLGAGSLNMVATAVAADQQRSPEAEQATMRKTLGGKVLSAIALERVTGRKPDPDRLKELD